MLNLNLNNCVKILKLKRDHNTPWIAVRWRSFWCVCRNVGKRIRGWGKLSPTNELMGLTLNSQSLYHDVIPEPHHLYLSHGNCFLRFLNSNFYILFTYCFLCSFNTLERQKESEDAIDTDTKLTDLNSCTSTNFLLLRMNCLCLMENNFSTCVTSPALLMNYIAVVASFLSHL